MKRGTKYVYTAGKVQSIATKCTSSYSIIRAAVLPSQKQTEFYQVHIAANTTTGTALHATCTCIAGKCGACNHVAAQMFALDNHNRSASTPSCTSLPSQWNVPRRKATSVKDLQVVKPVLGKSQRGTTKPSPAVDPKVGYVSVARIKSLQEDLKRNHVYRTTTTSSHMARQCGYTTGTAFTETTGEMEGLLYSGGFFVRTYAMKQQLIQKLDMYQWHVLSHF